MSNLLNQPYKQLLNITTLEAFGELRHEKGQKYLLG